MSMICALVMYISCTFTNTSLYVVWISW